MVGLHIVVTIAWPILNGLLASFEDTQIYQICKYYLLCSYTHQKNFLGSNNVDLYKVLVKELARMLERQFSGNAESRAAGMVINTMGWIEGVGYEVSEF